MLTKVKKPLFHDAVSAWFEGAFAAPTAAQAEAWPAIKAGRNVLDRGADRFRQDPGRVHGGDR